MKRIALSFAALALVVLAVFLAFFTASGFRDDDQSYLASLSDFTFMVGTFSARFMGLDPPTLSDWSYRRFMAHATKQAHWEVREALLWRLSQWGDAVEPNLFNQLGLPAVPFRTDTWPGVTEE